MGEIQAESEPDANEREAPVQADDGDARENTQQEDVVSRPPQPSPGATMSDDASSDTEMSDEVQADQGLNNPLRRKILRWRLVPTNPIQTWTRMTPSHAGANVNVLRQHPLRPIIFGRPDAEQNNHDCLDCYLWGIDSFPAVGTCYPDCGQY